MITTYIYDEEKNRFLIYTVNCAYNNLNKHPGQYDPFLTIRFFESDQFSNFKIQIQSAKTQKNVRKKIECARTALKYWTFGLVTKSLSIGELKSSVVLLRNLIDLFQYHPNDVWIRNNETNRIYNVKRDEYLQRKLVMNSLQLRMNKLLCDM